MTTPLKSLRSTLPSSSKLGKRLGRNITSAVARRGAGHCCHGSSSQRPSFTTVHSFCIRATSVAIKSHQAAEIGERGLPRASRGLGLAAATWQPSFRLFSSAPAALFGDTIIVTKRCAEVGTCYHLFLFVLQVLIVGLNSTFGVDYHGINTFER